MLAELMLTHLALFASMLLLPAEPQLSSPPTILVFLTDDLGWWDTSIHGTTEVQTPHMQRLAEEGLTFWNAFVASPSCAPSRAALLTGLMPARNGAESNHSYAHNEIARLPEYLHRAGYEVAAFGKIAHGREAERIGFDHVDRRHDPVVVARYLARRRSTRPLCLMVGTHDPHVPWPSSEGYDESAHAPPVTHLDTPKTRLMRARYYADITRADGVLGQVRDLVEDRFGDRVVTFFSSDHGAQWPFGKWNLYDAGIRVPLVVAWPGVVDPGTKTEAMVSWVDILPTLLEIAGAEAPEQIDGRSFLKLLLGETDSHRDQILTTHTNDGRFNIYPMRSIRTSRWKLILNMHPEYAYTTHIDQAQGKDGLVYWSQWLELAQTDPHAARIVGRYYRRPPVELYDLSVDPHERNDLAGLPESAQVVTELRRALDAWMVEQGDSQRLDRQPRLLARPEDWQPAPLVEDQTDHP